jgi:hypothetical protein
MTSIDDHLLAHVTGGLSNAKKCATAVGVGAGSVGAIGALAGAPTGLGAGLVGAVGAIDGAVTAYLVTPACHPAK